MLYGPITICFEGHVNCFDSNLDKYVKTVICKEVNMYNYSEHKLLFMFVTKLIVEMKFLCCVDFLSEIHSILLGIPN